MRKGDRLDLILLLVVVGLVILAFVAVVVGMVNGYTPRR
jgi:hypothetical protein